MTHNTKVMIRKTLFIVLTFISVLLFMVSVQTTRRYEKLREDYIDQVVEYNKLSEKHIQLTDQHWSLQQQVLKEAQ